MYAGFTVYIIVYIFVELYMPMEKIRVRFFSVFCEKYNLRIIENTA